MCCVCCVGNTLTCSKIIKVQGRRHDPQSNTESAGEGRGSNPNVETRSYYGTVLLYRVGIDTDLLI